MTDIVVVAPGPLNVEFWDWVAHTGGVKDNLFARADDTLVAHGTQWPHNYSD